MDRHFRGFQVKTNQKGTLRRIVSFSATPTSRRMTIGGYYRSEDPSNFMRRSSSEFMLDNGSSIRKTNISAVGINYKDGEASPGDTTVFYVDSFESHEWRGNSKNRRPDIEIEDLSSTLQSTKLVEAEQNRQEQQKVNPECYRQEEQLTANFDSAKAQERYENSKRKLRPLVKDQKQKQERKKRGNFWKMLFFLLLPIVLVVLATLLFNWDSQYHCMEYSDFATELREKIYGQDKAIAKITKYLNDESTCSKVLVLLGSSGVGKSYTAEIIRRNFHEQHKIRYLQLDNIDIEKLPLVEACSLVILENLKKQDIPKLTSFLKSQQNARKLLEKTFQEKHCFVILSIMNIEEINELLERNVDLHGSMSKIENLFQQENIEGEVIGYNTMSDEALRECIKNVERDNNMKLSPRQMESVKESLRTWNTGCKRTHIEVELVEKDSQSPDSVMINYN